MPYQEIKVSSDGLSPEDREVLIASLYDLGFEGFIEEKDFLKAYISTGSYLDSHSEMILSFLNSRNVNPQLVLAVIQDKNWNKEWEKSFQPVIIDNRCAVKASFHNIPDLEYNIIIDPEMSFGTGHHETTQMMIRHILGINLKEKDVLDMGCGTGVLGILAYMMGAASVTAIDIDENACDNSLANFYKNNIISGYTVLNGDASIIKGKSFDVILANINRNIILKDINRYYKSLRHQGILVISGILAEDEKIIRKAAEKTGLTFLTSTCENRWISLKMTRESLL